jgi:DNA polymerase III epsilon subunit-like protein
MYLFFDTETTGLPRNWQAPVTDLNNWPRMVQLAWLLYDETHQEIKRRDYIIKPEGYLIPAAAAKVHGISTEKALAEGVELSAVLREFADEIKQAKYLVAHNMSFDEMIAGAEFLRKEIANDLFRISRVCTMKSSTEFVNIPGNYGPKWPSLAELHFKLFSKGFEGAHDALVDVDALARCFFELKKQRIIDYK